MNWTQTPLPYPHPCLEALRAAIASELDRPSVVHGADHVLRVAALADSLARAEGADRLVSGAAALLHDLCRAEAGGCHAHRAAERARALLVESGFPPEKVEAVVEAVRVHRFSAGLAAPTLEAQVLQDADRLDAIGAIGVLRAFAYGGEEGRWAYCPEDPFHRTDRPLADGTFTIDHFYRKLLVVAGSLGTATARRMARRRHAFLLAYLAELETELAEAAVVPGVEAQDARELLPAAR